MGLYNEAIPFQVGMQTVLSQSSFRPLKGCLSISAFRFELRKITHFFFLVLLLAQSILPGEGGLVPTPDE